MQQSRGISNMSMARIPAINERDKRPRTGSRIFSGDLSDADLGNDSSDKAFAYTS